MRRTLIVLTALVLASCGGSGPSTPDGYATYDGEQASFAYPPGWTAKPADGGAVARPKGMDQAEVAPQVELRVTSLGATGWDSFLEQSRAVTETVVSNYKGKLSDYDVDVDGAKQTSGAEVNYTAPDGKPYRAVTVDALLADGKTVIALTAGGRPEDKLDMDGVIKSLDLK